MNVKRIAMLAMAGGVALGCPACQSPPQAASSDAEPASAGRAMPEDPRAALNEIKEARYQAAIAGLNFDTGLVVVTEPAAEQGRAAAETQRAEGRRKLDANKRTGALASFAAAVRADPTWADAYIDLGRALITKGRNDHALAAFRTALVHDPDAVDALFEAAMSLARDGRYTEAIEQMGPVLDLDPGRAEAHERLAIWHYYAGDADAAWRHVAAARELGREPPAQFLVLLEARSPHRPAVE
jgi:tetratricopeptide (TPR) repeat protein